MKIHRSIDQAIRQTDDWNVRWKGSDQGLIASWERGRDKRREDPSLAEQAASGQLVPLPWKGGVEKAIKGQKFGSLYYLAMWQGLRNEDLNIDLENDTVLTCSATGMKVAFTPDRSKYVEP